MKFSRGRKQLLIGLITLFLSCSIALCAEANIQKTTFDNSQQLNHDNFSAAQIQEIEEEIARVNNRYNPRAKLKDSYLLLNLKSVSFSPDKQYIVTLNYPNADYLTFFIPNNEGGIRKILMGDELAFNDREVHYRLPSAHLNTDSYLADYVLVHMLDTINIGVDAVITEQSKFAKRVSTDQFAYGLFFGSLIALAIYNLVLLLFSGEQSYGWYSGYVLVTALLLAYMSGIGQSVLWPNLELEGGNTRIGFWAAGGITISMTGFVYTFLSLDEKHIVFKRSSIIVILLIVGIMIGLLFNHHGDLDGAFFIVSAIQMLAILTVSVIVYLQDRGATIYLLLGYLILFPAIFASLLKFWGVLGSSDLVNHGYELAVLIEAFILSFGVGEKFRQLKGRELIAVKSLKDNKQHFLTNLMNVREQEKREFGVVLHNSVVQNLAVIRTKLRKLSAEHTKGDSDVLLDYIDHSIEDIRNISHLTYPHVLEQFGLVKAVEQYAENNLDEREIDWVCKIDDLMIEKDQQLILYRIVQEAINNVYRHAQASIVRIEFSRDLSEYLLTINDDGIGIKDKPEGFGLATIRQYASLLNGELTINSQSNQGSELVITFPAPINNV